MVAMWMIEAARHAGSLDHPYGWIITRDRNHEIQQACRDNGIEPLNDDPSEVGTIGPKSIPDDIEARLKAGEGIEFRLLDEGDLDECSKGPKAAAEGDPDYGVVFEGRLIDPEEMWSMAPLDDFGAYRAVGLQFRTEAGGWEWV